MSRTLAKNRDHLPMSGVQLDVGGASMGYLTLGEECISQYRNERGDQNENKLDMGKISFLLHTLQDSTLSLQMK